tara:strand:- start:375 stop:953 length:579 start_codon:yes stop_codon:yes gene_type:complete
MRLVVYVKRRVLFLFITLVCATISSTANGEIEDNQSGEVIIVSVDSTNLRFSPSEITLNEGDSVRFFWSGELLPHNAVEKGGLFDSGDPSREVDFVHTFAIGQNGTYEFVCEPHEDFGMVGTINVEPLELPSDPVSDENESSEELNSESSEKFKLTFFGLELMVLGAIGFLIYQVGRIRSFGIIRMSESEEE